MGKLFLGTAARITKNFDSVLYTHIDIKRNSNVKLYYLYLFVGFWVFFQKVNHYLLGSLLSKNGFTHYPRVFIGQGIILF